MSDAISDLYFQVAELRRQLGNMIRPGRVKSFDAATNSVVADIGVETHPVPVANQAGSAKAWHPMTPGQQITIFSPDGDPANAFCLPGGFHDANPAPSQSANEDMIARGAFRLRLTDDAAWLESSAASIKIAGDTITLTATRIILAGESHLGGEGGVPVAMQGTIDTAGNADVSNLATRVFVQ